MAWIETHQALITHRKTMALSDELGISIPAAVGHLICFWLWALDNAPDGNLDNVPFKAIATTMYWRKQPAVLVGALVKVGFLDAGDDGAMAIHDWADYGGKLLASRERTSDRTRDMRRAYADGTIDAVRQRDGDTCRYCACEVNWTDRKTLRGGTYDHIDPAGQSTVENLVVACRSCNASKGRKPLRAFNVAFNVASNAHLTTVQNSTEQKKTEQKPAAAAREVNDDQRRAARAWNEQSPGSLNPVIIRQLDDWLADGIPIDWLETACSEAGKNGGRKPVKYVNSILERWRKDGFQNDSRAGTGNGREPGFPTPFISGLRIGVAPHAERSVGRVRPQTDSSFGEDREEREADQ